MMVVASPRATMASQLRKGTVQLNVLEEEIKTQRNKQPVNRRRGKAQPARRVGVSGAVLILPNINNLIWSPDLNIPHCAAGGDSNRPWILQVSFASGSFRLCVC